MYSSYLDIKPEVAKALEEGTPVVALESTIIAHGMPYPKNVETAIKVEEVIREGGAVPATIAIINGRIKIGLTEEEIEAVEQKVNEVIFEAIPQETKIMAKDEAKKTGAMSLFNEKYDDFVRSLMEPQPLQEQ